MQIGAKGKALKFRHRAPPPKRGKFDEAPTMSEKQPLVRICIDTRWACRHDAINAVAYTFEALVSALGDIADGDDRPKGVEAMGLLLRVKSFKFLLSLIVFDRVLTCTKGLSDHLQNPRL